MTDPAAVNRTGRCYNTCMRNQELSRYVQLALDGVHREYPYHLSRLVLSEGTIETPRSMTPVFYGCYDWHSAVHGHWLLAIGMRLLPNTSCAEACRTALRTSFQSECIAAEKSHLEQRPGFERPYGLAWFLALIGELHIHADAESRQWRMDLADLESVARRHLISWLPKLSYPIRCGTHAQTAFSMGLIWDWATVVDDIRMMEIIRSRAAEFHGDDHDYPLHLEPSGEDFLSSSLGSASLMTRTLDRSSFQDWLDRTMPTLGREYHFEAVESPDPSDGRLTHLNGLNLSRAWMLWEISECLDDHDDRKKSLKQSAQHHADAGIAAVTSEHYEGGHWLGTFAAYMNLRMNLHK